METNAFSFSEHEFTTFLSALRFAAEKHREQKRKDQVTPYINHPVEVTELLWRVGGVRDLATLVAALLHDTVEDTGVRPEELREHFGAEVAAIVLEVTDDKGLPKQARKQHQIEEAPGLSKKAKTIKLADKINNIESILNLPPTDWSLERKREYIAWAEKVVSGLRGANAGLEARFDATLIQARRVLGE